VLICLDKLLKLFWFFKYYKFRTKLPGNQRQHASSAERALECVKSHPPRFSHGVESSQKMTLAISHSACSHRGTGTNFAVFQNPQRTWNSRNGRDTNWLGHAHHPRVLQGHVYLRDGRHRIHGEGKKIWTNRLFFQARVNITQLRAFQNQGCSKARISGTLRRTLASKYINAYYVFDKPKLNFSCKNIHLY